MVERRKTARPQGDDLLRRLQKLLYEYHQLGRFEEAKPHILWLMEIAESEGRGLAAEALTYNA